ncbi:MAG: hypothetical protein BZ138_04690, partial [Methanosphaera sp. rholeuAM270]
MLNKRLFIITLAILLFASLSVISAIDANNSADTRDTSVQQDTTVQQDTEYQTTQSNYITTEQRNATQKQVKAINKKTQKNTKGATEVVTNYEELNNKLTDANANRNTTISLEGDEKVYIITNPITVNSNIKNLVIEGNGKVLDGLNQSSFLRYSNGINLTINNLTIRNCYNNSDKSTALYCSVNNNIILNNSQFIGNLLEFENEADERGTIYGGTVYFKAKTLTIDNSNFNQNKIHSRNNWVYGGGAIYFDGRSSNVTIRHSSFNDNEIYSHDGGVTGGVFHIDGYQADTINISDSSFDDNTVYASDEKQEYETDVSVSGGAFYIYGYSLKKFSLFNTSFDNNEVQCNNSDVNGRENGGVSGAGLYLYDYNAGPKTIINSSFNNNVIHSSKGDVVGGALYIHASYSRPITMSNSSFESNKVYSIDSDVSGGAVYVSGYDGDPLTVTDCNFTSNKIIEKNTLEFYDESRLYAPALETSHVSLTLNRTNFIDNSIAAEIVSESVVMADGGSLYAGGGNITIDESNFKNNGISLTALGEYWYTNYLSAGAMHVSGEKIRILNTNVTDNGITVKSGLDYYNNYDLEGGAIVISAGGNDDDTPDLIINGTTISYNSIDIIFNPATGEEQSESVTTRGGALYLNEWDDDVYFVIENSIFEYNGIFINDNNDYFGMNNYGGAIYSYLSPDERFKFEIRNTNFTKNSICASGTENVYYDDNKSNGGAIFIENYNYDLVDSDLIIDKSNFFSNSITAPEISDGGAIYVRGVDLKLNQTSFKSNELIVTNATSAAGGAVYIIDGNLVMVDSNFTDNSVIFDMYEWYGDAYAGALEVYEGIVNITDSNFKNNKITSTSSNGAYAGAIRLILTNATVTNTNITGNKLNLISEVESEDYSTSIRMYGGSLCAEYSNVTLNNTRIVQNGINVAVNSKVRSEIEAFGGGIYADMVTNLYLDETTLLSNNINIDFNEDGTDEYHEDLIIASGGAVYSGERVSTSAANITIKQSQFESNTININSPKTPIKLESNGGAITADGVLKIEINDTNISKNSVNAVYKVSDNNYEYLVDGGALFFNNKQWHSYKVPQGNVTISNSNIIQNTIKSPDNAHGGAISINNINLSINATNITNNLINAEITEESDDNININGGSISSLDSNITITDTNIKNHAIAVINNQEESDINVNVTGGAISSENTNITITNTNFTKNNINLINCDNKNNLSGGAIYANKGNITITDSNFTSNVLNDYSSISEKISKGGAISIVNDNYSTLNIENVKFTDNHAETEGGAIYRDSGRFKINLCEFINNTPENFILADDDSITLNKSDNFIPNNNEVTIYLDDSQEATQTSMEDNKIKDYPISQGLTQYKLVLTMTDNANYDTNENEFTENIFYTTIEHDFHLTVELVPYVKLGDEINITGRLYTNPDENIPNNQQLAGKTIKLYINGTPVDTTTTNSSGGYNFTYTTTAAGYQNVSVNLTGDENIPSLNKTAGFYVETDHIETDIIPTTITITAPNTYINNETYKFTITVKEIREDEAFNLPCNITLLINGESRNVELTTGEITIEDYVPNIIGTNTIVAYFAGNETHNSSMNNTGFNVSKRITQIEATQDGTVKDNVTINYGVADITIGEVPITEGTITIYDEDGNIIKSAEFIEEIDTISITDLEPGEHTLTIVYNGNQTYNQSSQELKVKQLPKADITIKVLNNTEGNVTIEVTVTNGTDPIGLTDVTITLPNGTTTTKQTDTDGKITLIDPTATVGDKTTTVTIETADDYIGTSTTKDVTIIPEVIVPVATEIIINAPNTYVNNGSYAIRITVKENRDGEATNLPCNITLMINNQKRNVELSTGEITIEDYVPTLVGPNTVVAYFTGNETHNSSMNQTSFNVSKRVTEIEAVQDSNTKDNVTINYNVADVTTTETPISSGMVVVLDEDGNIVKSATFDKESNTIVITDLSPGEHALTVVYNGNESYNQSSRALTVKQLPRANITIKVLNNTEGNVTIEYTITNGTNPINDEVTIVLPNGSSTIKTPSGGKVTIVDATIKPGDYTTTATIATSDAYIGTTESKDLTVIAKEPIPTEITIETPNTYVYNDSYAIKIMVKEHNGDTITKLPCNVTVVINGESRIVELASGEYSIPYTPTVVGTNNVVVYLAENETHNSSMNKSSFTVNKRLTQIKAAQDGNIQDNVTISYNVADVTTTEAPISSGMVVVLDEDGNVIKSATFDK